MALVHLQHGDVAGTRPCQSARSRRAEVNPWPMFAVDGLVNTLMPCARRIATSIFVVVDLPLDPEWTTSP